MPLIAEDPSFTYWKKRMDRLSERREGRAKKIRLKEAAGENLPVVPVPWRETESEFEIQSFVYSSLLALGVKARGEVACERSIYFRGSRLDVVVYDAQLKAILILEIKNSGSADSQVKRYAEAHRLPVFAISGKAEAQDFINRVSNRELICGVKVL